MAKQIKNTNYQDKSSGKPFNLQFDTIWKQRDLAVPLIIVLALTAFIYTHALRNEILSWDDGWHVTYNNDIRSLSPSSIKNIFTSFYGNMYHPVTTLTFAVEYEFFGLNPAVYHATNVLFHLANVVLVFFLVLRLSNRRETAVIAACLFGIHPMHVESVAWITERKDVVYAFFYLLALICYVRFIQREGKKYYWWAILFFILSLFSKTTAITLPIAFILIDVYFHRKLKIRKLLDKLPLFLLSLVFGLIALHSQSPSTSYAVEKGLVFFDRFFLVSYSICYYIIHLFAPINLSAIHLLPEKVNGFLPIEYYIAAVPLLVLVFLSLRKGAFQRELIFGLLFFVATISLSIHIIPIGMAIVSERYTYIPYIGLYYIIGQLSCYAIDRYQGRLFAWKRVVRIAVALAMVLFGYLTYQRIGVWKNTQILFKDASLKAGSVKEANYIESMGCQHEAVKQTRAANYSEAIKWYNKAIVLDSTSAESYSNRGIAKQCLEDYEGAMIDYTRAIEINPLLARAYPNRAAIYLLWNRKKEACADLQTAYNLGEYNVFEIMGIDCP